MTRYAVGERDSAGVGRFTGLVYGDPGMGKTHLLATTPVDTLVVELDFTGAETLEKGDTVTDLKRRGVNMWVEEPDSDQEAIRILKVARKEIIQAKEQGQPLPYKMIALDGLCALEDFIYSDLVGQGGSYVQNSRPEMMSQGGWGALGARHLAVRRAALRIPYVHVVFTALQRTRQDEDTKVPVVETALGGQQGRRYQADVSYVFRLMSTMKADGNVQNWLSFERSPKQRTKARRDDLLGRGKNRIQADLGIVMKRLGYLDNPVTENESAPVEATKAAS